MRSGEDTGCLSLEAIADLVTDEAHAARLVEFEGHVARCSRCQQLIAAAVSGVGAADEPGRAPTLPRADEPSSQALRALVARLVASHPGLTDTLRAFDASAADASGSPREWGSFSLPAVANRFAVGDVIGERFRVRRFISRGGMGEVYEVDDQELGTRIALKVMAVEAQAQSEALARFRREVALARSITHPNVCRVFDVGFHERREPELRVAFMTMELLAGETLSARLRRTGRLPLQQALPIVRDVCAGLSAAHAAGVIHRDFKSSNVILHALGNGHVRAVVSDFGLACLHEADVTLTRQGQVLGTPATMAPEQILGEATSAATDVYALGCVLFEMLTGALPFSGAAFASLRLTQPAPSLRQRLPEASVHCERVVGRCLERRPERRFQSVREVVSALDPGSEIGVPRRGKARAAAIGASVAAALAVTGAFWHQRGSELITATTSPPGNEGRGVHTETFPLDPSSKATPRRIAIFPPTDLTRRSADGWLATALPEMLTAELGGSSRVQPLPGDRVARAVRDLREQGSLEWSPERMASVTAADLLLHGSYAVVRDGAVERMRVDLSIFDAAAQQPLAAVTAVGTTAQLFELVAHLGGELRERLGMPPAEPAFAQATRAASSENPAAARSHAEGLTALRGFDLKTASERFLAVVELDPQYALGHSELANVYRLMGKDDLARKEAARALTTSHQLTRELQLVVEARAHATSQEWGRAADSYDTLARFYPANLYYGTQLARMFINDGRPADAFEVVARLRALPAPMSDDPELDVLEALTATKASDYARCLGAAQTALEKGKAAGSRSLIAEARSMVAEAQYHLGDRKAALEGRLAAHDLYEALGDRRGVARSLDALSDLYFEAGDFAKSLSTTTQALLIAREIGHQYRIGGLLNAIGEVQQTLGDLTAAQRSYELARDTYLAMNEREGVGHTTTNLGSILFEQGALKEARASFEKALALHVAVGARIGEGYEHIQIGRVAHAMGELPEARERCKNGLAIERSVQNIETVAEAQLALSQIYRDEDDPASAQTAAQEAFDISRKLGDLPALHDAELQLAGLALDVEDGGTAARLANAVTAEPGSSPAQQALAHALRARALALTRNIAEATAAAQLATGTAAALQGFISQAEVHLAVAEQRALAGDLQLAIQTATEVLELAQARDHIRLSFEARWLLARLTPGATRARRALSAAARAQKFARIARLAGAAPRAPGR